MREVLLLDPSIFPTHGMVSPCADRMPSRSLAMHTFLPNPLGRPESKMSKIALIGVGETSAIESPSDGVLVHFHDAIYPSFDLIGNIVTVGYRE